MTTPTNRPIEKRPPQRRGVRKGRIIDLPFIREWLALEVRGEQGFIHNWRMIEEACSEGQMLVWVDQEGPIGFLTRGISPSSILQVKSDRKRHGIGRALVERAIREEEANDNAVLVVQCEPTTSIEFWKSMGFETQRGSPHDRIVYMQRLSTKRLSHVTVDEMVLITIRVFAECVLYKESTSHTAIPDRVYHVHGRYDEKTHDIALVHRVAISHEPALRDPVVEVEMDGFEILPRMKVKREAARAVGFVETDYGWYIDVIKRSAKFEA